jgi:hypothetical protein
MTNRKMKEIKYIILYIIPVKGTDPVPVSLVKKLRFLRFWFRFQSTGKWDPCSVLLIGVIHYKLLKRLY